jgi:PPOX class probable F420-dependent enzyme
METKPIQLSHDVRRFLDEPNFAVLATAGQDGEPHQAVLWYRLEPDGRILLNSRVGRRWPAELRLQPRCSVAVAALGDAYRWVGLQAIVEAIDDDLGRARDDIVVLAERYGETDPESTAAFRSQPRITFRLAVIGVHDHLDGD